MATDVYFNLYYTGVTCTDIPIYTPYENLHLSRVFNEPSASCHYIGSTSTITNSITTAIYLAKTVSDSKTNFISSNLTWTVSGNIIRIWQMRKLKQKDSP